MKLTEAEKERLTRGIMASDFLSGDFFQKYLFPYIQSERDSIYPDPGKKGWEDQYRLAYAKDEVFTSLMKNIKLWADEKKDLTAKTRETEPDINLA